MKKTDYIEEAQKPDGSAMANEPALSMYAATSTINIPVSIPAGIDIDIEGLRKKLTTFALTLIRQKEEKAAVPQESPYYSSFVRNMGFPVDFSDMPDEREAYRKHLNDKYA